MPGAAPTVVDYRGASYWAAVGEKAAPVLVPIVLEPVGERVKWIADTPCAAARRLRDLAASSGWWAGLSRSKVLYPPAVSGKFKGVWVQREYIAVRLRRGREYVGFGIWKQPEGGSWGFDSAGMLEGGKVRWLNLGQLEALVQGVPYVPPKPRAPRKKKGEGQE